jgi:ubiquinone/menaquinone biosynthesis C-methylase UbiE
MVDLDAYRTTSRAVWDEIAPGWEKRREWMMGITGLVHDWIVEQADPRPGQTFLDIAAGTGDLGRLVAERVGDEGRVISTDFAAEMVDVARRLGEAGGLTNIEYRVLDAERMDLDDVCVDGVVSRFSYMLMADPAAALRETRRVLRDGGPLAFAVWSTAERNPWAAVPAMTMVQLGHIPPPEPGAPGIFAMGMPPRTRELVASAGFAEPEITELAFHYRYADADDFWDAILSLSGPLARVIRALPEPEREAARSAIMGNVAPYRDGDGSYTMPAACWGVLTR